MSRLGFIEVPKLPNSKPAVLSITVIRAVAKYDDNAVIDLVGRDQSAFSVAESYEQGTLSNAGGKVNRMASSEAARG